MQWTFSSRAENKKWYDDSMKRIFTIFFLLFSIISLHFSFADAPENEIRKFKKKSYILSESDLAVLRDEVRNQCNLQPAREEAYPWYYHYELGLKLTKKDDWQRALDSFLNALDRRGRPQKFTRMYGMWFLDYYPYYNIGL